MAASHCGNIHDQEEASAPGADLYAVLGLNRECTDAELRVAYRRLAMIWHPDRCSASGSSARVEEAKERFQEIQGAYSVLSDSNKRLLYDVGIYDSEDDEADLSGMGDFLGEMADMMSQATPTETFEELQQVFVDMFQDDLDDAGFFGGLPTGRRAQAPASTSLPPSPAGRNKGAQAPSSSFKGVERRGSTAKRPRPGSAGLEPDLGLSGFCFMECEGFEGCFGALAGGKSVDKRPGPTSSLRGAVVRRTPAFSGGGYNRRGPPIPCRVDDHPYTYQPTLLCRYGLKTPRWISWSDRNPGCRYHRCCRANNVTQFFLVHYVFTMQMLKSHCTYGIWFFRSPIRLRVL